jgi:hypothetical protein
MDSQSKIVASVIVGLALGATLVALIYRLKQDGNGHHLKSAGNANDGPAVADDWSDMNDSLGG